MYNAEKIGGGFDAEEVKIAVFPPIFNPLVTIAPNHSAITSCKPTTTFEVIKEIMGDRHKSAVDEIRACKDKEERKKLKARLPVVLWHGEFTAQKTDGLVNHSGLICVDLDLQDHGEGVLESKRAELCDDPHVFCLFSSPSGGLKVVLKIRDINAENHKLRGFPTAKQWAESHGLVIDEACKDIPRRCYISHDPDIYYNSGSVSLQMVEAEERREVNTAASGTLYDDFRELSHSDKVEEARSALEAIPRQSHDNWKRMIAATIDAVGETDALALLKDTHREEAEGEYEKAFRNPMRDIKAATLFHMARQSGWSYSPPLPEVDAATNAAVEALLLKHEGDPDDFSDLFDDVSHLWEGDIEPVLPTIGSFAEGKCLFYGGEVNEIHGEAGIAKTWVVLLVMVQEMSKGNHVIYLDPESSAKKIIGRLRTLGANNPRLFHYRSTSFEDERTWQRYKLAVENMGATVLCLDGLVNFIAASGGHEDDNAASVKTLATIAKPMAQAGAAVVVIDHTPKHKLTKGARGAGSKRGFYKGASYHIKTEKAFSRTQSGHALLILDKDNEGGIGAVGDHIAEIHCTVDDEGSHFDLRDANAGANAIIKKAGRPPKYSSDDILALLPQGKANRVPIDNIQGYGGDKRNFKKLVEQAGGHCEKCTDSSMVPKNHYWRD